jgi:hypothetical protein
VKESLWVNLSAGIFFKALSESTGDASIKCLLEVPLSKILFKAPL